MEPTHELLLRIGQTGRRMSKSQKRIAEYIINSYDKAAFMTAAKLGEKVGVSESTVVRFAIALGYEGYPELSKALQEMIRTRLTNVQRMHLSNEQEDGQVVRSVLRTDVNNIRQTIEELDLAAFDQTVDALCSARRIYVCGLRASAPLAELLCYYLDFVFENVHRVRGSGVDAMQQLLRISEGDVLIGISFPRYSSRTLKAMQFARRQGATIIAVTDRLLSPVAQIAHLTLSARSEMASFVDSLVAPMSVLNALIVALGLRNRERLEQTFENLEQLWDEADVYVGKDKMD